jgi:Holliday junction resolvase
MPNRNYQRGRAFEYKVKKHYESLGWFVVRAAGSKGPADLLAVPGWDDPAIGVMTIQCKTRRPTEADKTKLREFSKKYKIWCFLAYLEPGRRYCASYRPFETLAV